MINGRTKGHSFERKIAQEFRSLGWSKALRNLEYQSQVALDGVDILNTEPFLVQCKCKKDYVPVNTIKEVRNKEGYYPLLITQGTRKEPMVVMRWKDFKEILGMLKKEGIF
jgi:hypothetical protein